MPGAAACDGSAVSMVVLPRLSLLRIWSKSLGEDAELGLVGSVGGADCSGVVCGAAVLLEAGVFLLLLFWLLEDENRRDERGPLCRANWLRRTVLLYSDGVGLIRRHLARLCISIMPAINGNGWWWRGRGCAKSEAVVVAKMDNLPADGWARDTLRSASEPRDLDGLPYYLLGIVSARWTRFISRYLYEKCDLQNIVRNVVTSWFE